jgi:cytochrome c peroxidase
VSGNPDTIQRFGQRARFVRCKRDQKTTAVKCALTKVRAAPRALARLVLIAGGRVAPTQKGANMSRLMGIRELFLSTAVITLLGVTACGDDDDPAGAAGSAGTSGRGGSSGSAGASGSAGTSGAAGSGGSSGSSGSSGTAGADAGDGSSGTGGSAGSDPDAGDGSGDAGVLTPLELELLKTLSPLPGVPADSTNRVANNAAAAALGQKLFFDQNFSGPLQIDNDLGTTGQSGKVSCASCHSSSYMDDARSMPRTVSQGTNFHTRNSPTMINASFYKWVGWGGRFSAQWELPIAVVESGVIMNGNRLKVAHRIFDVYKSDYETVFNTTLEPELANTTRFPPDGKPKPAPTTAVPNPPDGPWETAMTDPDRLIVNTILANYGKAIAAYMRLLVSRDAPFDGWIGSNGTNTAIDAAAARGAKLFVGKARCISCHSGPHFSDDKFHNLGVPQQGDRVPPTDDGRFANGAQLLGSPFNVNGAFSDDTNTGRLAGLTNPMPADTKGAFRTPGLRGIAQTAPYMHSGQIATLEDVVDFYNRGGGTPPAGQTKDSQMFPLGLTAGEQADLVSFLKTLNGAAVPAALLMDSTP